MTTAAPAASTAMPAHRRQPRSGEAGEAGRSAGSPVVGIGIAGIAPGVQLGGVGEHRAALAVLQATHGKAVALLPALRGPDVAPEVGGDLLPRVQAGATRVSGGLCARSWFLDGHGHPAPPC